MTTLVAKEIIHRFTFISCLPRKHLIGILEAIMPDLDYAKMAPYDFSELLI